MTDSAFYLQYLVLQEMVKIIMECYTRVFDFECGIFTISIKIDKVKMKHVAGFII
jgi:hypothetical protein